MTELAGKTGTAVSGSNKTSKAGTAYFAGITETSETAETQKIETDVSESNKNTTAEKGKTETAGIRTAGKNEKSARETILGDETGTALTEAATADSAESKKNTAETRRGWRGSAA